MGWVSDELSNFEDSVKDVGRKFEDEVVDDVFGGWEGAAAAVAAPFVLPAALPALTSAGGALMSGAGTVLGGLGSMGGAAMDFLGGPGGAMAMNMLGGGGGGMGPLAGLAQGYFGSEAAGDAAKAQVQANREAIAFQREQLEQARRASEPFRMAGQQAINPLLSMLGIAPLSLPTSPMFSMQNQQQVDLMSRRDSLQKQLEDLKARKASYADMATPPTFIERPQGGAIGGAARSTMDDIRSQHKQQVMAGIEELAQKQDASPQSIAPPPQITFPGRAPKKTQSVEPIAAPPKKTLPAKVQASKASKPSALELEKQRLAEEQALQQQKLLDAAIKSTRRLGGFRRR